MIINLFKRKNAKPEFEVLTKAPDVDPVTVQKYRVETEPGPLSSGVTWKVFKGRERIGIDWCMYENDAERDILQFIKDHEFSGKIVHFGKVAYEVTVNRFEEGE